MYTFIPNLKSYAKHIKYTYTLVLSNQINAKKNYF